MDTKKYLLGVLVEKSNSLVVITLGIYFLTITVTFKRSRGK